jgi:trigger factor
MPRGAEYAFKGEIGHHSRLVLPDLDDEFAKSNGFENLADLRTQMTEAMTKQLERRTAAALRSQLMEELEERITFPVPQRYFQQHLRQTMGQQARILVRAGVNPKELDARGEQFVQLCVPLATRSCTQDIIIRRLASNVANDVAREEVMDRLLEMSQEAGQDPDQYLLNAEKDGRMAQVAEELYRERVLDQLLESCRLREITEAEWQQIQEKKRTETEARLRELDAQAEAQQKSGADTPTAGEAPAAESSPTAPAAAAGTDSTPSDAT